MKPFASTAVLTVFLAGSGFALASTDNDYEACMAESGGVTVIMLDCIGGAIDRAEARMNAILEEQRSRVTPEQASAVEASQRDWRSYRQSTCNAEAKLWGDGNFVSVVHSGCWLELTWERLDRLSARPSGPGS
jgi:uncharacterized protein YecT (DUF1311 family)